MTKLKPALVALAMIPLAACTTMNSMDAPMAAPMASGTVVDVAVSSPDHTTLIAAVQAAGLVPTLSGAGPFTVFAPTNAAFSALPAGTVETALRPENRAMLTGVLTYHVVAGNVSAADLTSLIQRSGGQATLTTVQGGTLTARVVNGAVVITDANGRNATVTTADLRASNGVVHITNGVFLPR